MKNLNQYMLESLKISDDYGTKNKEQLPNNCKKYFANKKVNVDEIEDFDTSNVTDMSSMFNQASFNSDSLDLSSWDVSNVKYMNSMFVWSNIKRLDLSNWDVSNVEGMNSMFCACSDLEYLDLSNWDVSNARDLTSMFRGCESLKSLDLSSWDVSNAASGSHGLGIIDMFNGCTKLEYLDISSWDVSNARDLISMFRGCESLKSLDLSNWDTSNIDDIREIFKDCYNLTDIKFGPNWGKWSSCNANLYGSDNVILDLSDCAKKNPSNFSDETFKSMLTMYDRKKAGLKTIWIKMAYGAPRDWVEKMEERGYKIGIPPKEYRIFYR